MHLATAFATAACVAYSGAVSAGTFGVYCRSDVACQGILGDIVTEKFTAKYPDKKWRIFIESHVYRSGRTSGAGHATVGVTPAPVGKRVIYPASTYSHFLARENIEGAYDMQQLERDVIRRAVEALMAKCNDSPDCNLE